MAESSLKKMASRIPESTIEEIRTRADIVDVVSEYVSLKQSGKNHKGLCPFHQEKTPSFNVSEEKQIYKCFGCSAGGNVFIFLMEIEGITFIDAVKKLGTRFHVPIPEKSLSPQEEKNRNDREIILNLNESAKDYFSHQLRKTEGGELARQYIKSRGFDHKTAEDFNLGWATPEWSGLLTHLNKKMSAPQRMLEKAGLITIKPATGGKKESQYDRFRNRLIFPLMDVFGNIIGFAGRIISDGEPKYLNSPETLLYKKGDHLYGLNKAKESIRKENKALLVEGYFDQICAYQNGIKNTVALCGTALTLNQVSLLRKYTSNIVLVFDSDSAGQAAAQRGFELLLSEGLNISVVLLPKGYDPDSYIQEKGKDKFLELIENAKPFLESLIDKTIAEGTQNATGKASTINKILPALAKIRSSVERTEYIRYLSEKADVNQKSILEDLSKIISGKKRIENEPKASDEKRPVLELFLIHIMLSDEQAAKEIKDQLTPDEYQDELYREIAQKLYSRIEEKQPLRLDLILEQTDNPEIKSVLSEFGVQPMVFDEISKAMTDCIRKIKKRNRSPKIIELRKQRNEADAAGLKEQSRELHNQSREFRT